MARARLHLICGNCGCNDEWTWEHMPKEVAFLEVDDVYIRCNNCSALHSINDNAKPQASPTINRKERE